MSDFPLAIVCEFNAKVEEQKTLLQEFADKIARDSDLAVDLGCGSGFQSVALADLCYKVLAIDTRERLLKDLAAKAESRNITTQYGDLLGLDSLFAPATVSIVVCMGDTLTHLTNTDEVSRLFRSVYRALKPRGQFVVTYRDLANCKVLTG